MQPVKQGEPLSSPEREQAPPAPALVPGRAHGGVVDADPAAWLARETFVAEGSAYGCAETTFVVLKRAYGAPDPDDPGRPWR